MLASTLRSDYKKELTLTFGIQTEKLAKERQVSTHLDTFSKSKYTQKESFDQIQSCIGRHFQMKKAFIAS